ncbi:MAG: thioredoxin domain-containing protein [Propionibacteriaceae bacterium]|jgi:protein-disulfide isomerase|nr:thioredoxin domain-containing protein [Propionibacteriaceae bacterium]
MSEYKHTADFGTTSAPLAVDLFYDYICPYCGIFENRNSSDIEQLVSDGTVYLRVHPLNFQDRASNGTRYSSRAANDFLGVYHDDKETSLKFSDLLFEAQPAEGTPGLDDEVLAGLALRAGASLEAIEAFAEHAWFEWLEQCTQEALESGMEGTPALRVNGEWIVGGPGLQYPLDYSKPGQVKQLLEEAAGL